MEPKNRRPAFRYIADPAALAGEERACAEALLMCNVRKAARRAAASNSKESGPSASRHDPLAFAVGVRQGVVRK